VVPSVVEQHFNRHSISNRSATPAALNFAIVSLTSSIDTNANLNRAKVNPGNLTHFNFPKEYKISKRTAVFRGAIGRKNSSGMGRGRVMCVRCGMTTPTVRFPINSFTPAVPRSNTLTYEPFLESWLTSQYSWMAVQTFNTSLCHRFPHSPRYDLRTPSIVTRSRDGGVQDPEIQRRSLLTCPIRDNG
jgi:hypothetical protein